MKTKVNRWFTWLTTFEYINLLLTLACAGFGAWPTVIYAGLMEESEISLPLFNGSSVIYMSSQVAFAGEYLSLYN